MESESFNPYQTMSITSFGTATLPDQKRPVIQYATRSINSVADIDGAQSTKFGDRYTNKPQFLNAEISGATSKPLTHARNVEDKQLYLDDIEGTRHSIKDRMMRTKRHVNPLVPDYNLPNFHVTSIPETKFVRDTLDITDIDGTKPRPAKTNLFKVRDTMNTTDIVGAQAGWKPLHRRARMEAEPHNILDIPIPTKNHNQFADLSKKPKDLLNPHYHVNGMDYYDDPRWTKPKKIPQFISDNHCNRTDDIEGASPGWGRIQRKEFRNLTSTQDIEGAQADTVIKSIKSDRLTCPLMPTYKDLDFGDPLPPLVTPLMPPSLIKEATIRFNVPKLNASNSSVIPNSKSDTNFGLTMTTSFADDRVESSEYDPVLFVKDEVPIKEKLSDSRFQLNIKNAAAPPQGRDSGRIVQPTTRGSNYNSPMVSGRVLNSARPSARPGRAAVELQAEINSVRSLPN